MGKLLCVGLGLCTFLFFSAIPHRSFAAIADVTFDGSFSGEDETPTSLRLLMGRARGATVPSCTGDVCSSCLGTATGGAPDICNDRWVPSTASVVFNFTPGTAGFPKVIGVDGSTNRIIQIDTVQIAANTKVSMTVPWSAICTGIGSLSDCSTDKSGTVKVGVGTTSNGEEITDSASVVVTIVGNPGTPTDPFVNTTSCGGTNLGLCDYTAFPGDEKIYIENAESYNMPVATAGLKFTKVRFYFIKGAATGTCAAQTFTNDGTEFKALDVEKEPTSAQAVLSNDILTDLENGVVHCLRSANVDEAGNIGYWSDPTTIKEVTPAEVIGYFTEERNCFIATAAYGSRMDPHVDTFRAFRDQVLSKYSLGRSFISYYYKHAYSWGQVIRKNEALRTLARFALWPVWFLASLTLAVSLPVVFALMIFIFALVDFLQNRTRRKRLWGIAFLLGSSLFFQTPNASAATKAERAPDAEKPPAEYPYPGASEEESGPTPLKTPTAKKKTSKKLDPNEPVLMRITKEGEYIYKRRASEQRSAASLRFGSFNIASAVNPETNLSFEEVYPDGGSIMFFDYEWQFAQSVGKLGLKLGTGVFFTSGDGRFREPPYNRAKEEYRFVMFPNNISGIWRAQFFDKQIIVPFVEAGGGYYTFAEIRDDFKRTKLGGVPIVQWAVGGSLLLDFLDPSAMIELDEDHGVNHLFLTAEFRSITAMKEDFDISNDLFSVGFLFEF